jgi:hypothetical protein
MSVSPSLRVQALALALAGSPLLHAGFLYNGVSPANRPWPGGTVPYVIDPALSVAQRKTYLDGIREWELAGNVQFIPRTTETNYVFLKYDPLGPNRVSGANPQIVEINALTRAQICHEMGHSLGLNHEHIRPDRNSFVTVQTANISAGNAFWFDIDATGVSNGTYDFESVMHFSRDLFSINPGVLDTLTVKPGYETYQARMGNFALSPGDRAAITWLYGAASLSSVVTTTADTGPGSLRAALYYATDHPGTTITFNIPVTDPGYASGVFTIKPTGHLPPLVTNGTKVDATSQPGYAGKPKVFIDGSDILTESGDPPGLMIYAANCTVKGLAFTRARWVGVAILRPEATGNSVCSCWSGVAPDGVTAHANAKQGVQISDGAHGNTIGPDNVLSGNTEYGVWISGSATTANVVRGNRIGTSDSGNTALANGIGGVIVNGGAHDNVIGGGNQISGNTNAGVWLTGFGVDANIVSNNNIGLNAAGNAALPNSFAGIYVLGGAADNVIRGNVLSGHPSEAVRISGADSIRNIVEDNLIGTNAAGTAAIPNGFAGATIFGGAAGNTISGNVVSGNTNYGVVIGDGGSNDNLVEGNLIGVLRNGAALGNGFTGLAIWNGAKDCLISGNLIRHNGTYGIALFNPTTTDGHTFSANSISDHNFAGIYTGGANHGQSAPTLGSAVAGASGLAVAGSLTSTPGAVFRIEFFANDPPGNNSGRSLLGTINGVTTDGSGNVAFNAALTTTAAAGKAITATATRISTADTSEFSLPVIVTATDGDSDGMPNAYETANGLNAAVNDAAGDADGDGASNLAEYLAGTDPRNGADYFKAGSVTKSGNNLILKFRVASGRNYQIQESTTLAAGSWRILIPLRNATGNELEVSTPIAAGSRFYRAVTLD